MSKLTIKTRVRLNTDIRDAILEGIELANRLKCNIEFNFNKINVIIKSDTDIEMFDIEKAFEKYNSERIEKLGLMVIM